jgi:ubiquinone/menaquinone biosynthesis C-methylase UbiE
VISPQRFARLVTRAVVSRPVLWRLLRRPMRKLFDRLAPRWDTLRRAEHLLPLETALAAVDEPPRRVLDLGTGTGDAAVVLARRWPDADVLGADVSPGMIHQARRKLPAELAGRVRFEVADAARLPYADGSFDLVALANMIPFFDELARVVAPGGHVAFGFSGGDQTPIYVPPERLRAELARRGFTDFSDFAAGTGTALLARKSDRG